MTHYQQTIARLTHLDAEVIETLMMEEHHTIDHLTEDNFRWYIASIVAVAANEGITPEAFLARERADLVASGMLYPR